MFKVSPASLQTFIDTPDCLATHRQDQWDTRLALTSSVIPNSNYVNMVRYSSPVTGLNWPRDWIDV
jgi:hypothetical protein